MSELPISEDYRKNEQPNISYFGYELIRDVLLPELLGKDAGEILYWAGKKLARKFPLENVDEVIDFFNEADWGTLSRKKEKKRELVLELTGEFVSLRLQRDKQSTFQLEAGFLAQQLTDQKRTLVETYEHPHKRSDRVLFTLKWE